MGPACLNTIVIILLLSFSRLNLSKKINLVEVLWFLHYDILMGMQWFLEVHVGDDIASNEDEVRVDDGLSVHLTQSITSTLAVL